MSMLNQGPSKEAKLIQEKTGVETVAAVDGMRIDFGETIELHVDHRRTQQGLENFL
jgi:hypothetical protein